ncbi:MAG TPA: L-seryl-tRNA(Sec) selenium transferase [Acidimicrobiia bacterium]
MTDNPYRGLPAVDVLADRIESTLPRPIVVDLARLTLEQARDDIAAGQTPDVEAAAVRMARAVERSAGAGVINATGVLLHTNLGRALWSTRAAERAFQTATSFSNVEMDLETGERSRRGAYVTRLLQQLTGAEDALLVNNNAAALLLALATTARGRAVPVSRGELIEIGGSYRLPAVIEASGARLVEIGTTNRTRLGDYVTALQTHVCGAILKVHPSNYLIEGFTEEAGLAELAAIKTEGVPLLYDLGSGLLDERAVWVPAWLKGEPGVRQALEKGADLVLFSGDKLIGGPQAGVLVGSAELMDRVRSNALTRALRVDGVTYAAMSATLETYLSGDATEIPFWRYALTSDESLEKRLKPLAGAVNGQVVPAQSVVGAGSAPGLSIPTPVLRIPGGDGLFTALLAQDHPVLTRRDRGDLIVDLRAVEPEDDQAVVTALERCR